MTEIKNYLRQLAENNPQPKAGIACNLTGALPQQVGFADKGQYAGPMAMDDLKVSKD